jgi:hypothetical protein
VPASSVELGAGWERLLHGVTPTDPATFATVAALLTVVAVVACGLPAHRAAAVDPSETLREDS